ncbi:uncharacterized protein LOC117327900 [Pecten maximus]|uniref:uncharacterized protein LOC117327900 n=1 Tax=Pecten maximus TaxID=6579 RepID=UPI00145846C9|nr:uncharacterized protein LOC117327900 [Pecten maximus]XP_033741023.1 uncharacterized protein LOC117327900 [Pecten maximus]XP_033741024.1 uncharacterized protein LOC117327900 [Pecten maximus]
MATGDKLMREISDQFLHCKICFEPFKNPKTLICLHTFCIDCLQQHVDSEGSRSRFSLYNRYVTCPICRRKTEIPTGGIRRLPDNFLLSNLTEIIDRRRPSKIPPCEICHTVRKRSNEACAKCLDCSKLLCKSCVTLHRETKVTQQHSLIDVEGEKDIECKAHPEEIVRFYCEPCDTCICIVCTFQEHRDHDICSFNDGYVKYKASMQGLLDESKSRITDINDRIEAINKCENGMKRTRENIRDLAISYIQQVRSTEKELLKSVDEYFGENVTDFLKHREWLQENVDELQSASNLTEIIMRDRGVELLLLKREMESKLHSLMEPNLPILPSDDMIDIHFNPGSVTFGTLSFQEDPSKDENGFLTNGDFKSESSLEKSPSKPKLVTSDTQTDPINEDVVPIKERPVKTRDVITNGYNEDTDRLSSRKRRSTDHAVCNGVKASVQTCNQETSTAVTSSDVALNTQAIPMIHKGLQVYSDPGTPGSGICAKCCEDLSTTAPFVGEAPKIQDIIVLNTTDNDSRESRRRRRLLIRSKRVQTDLSMTGDSLLEDKSKSLPMLTQLPNRSLSCDDTSLSKPEMRTVALDPINCDEPGRRHRRRMRDKTTMTIEEHKPVVETCDATTYTYPSRLRSFGTCTRVELSTVDTQTFRVNQISRSMGTDYAGQTDQCIGTNMVNMIDSETTMQPIIHDSKGTWTEALNTSERSMCTDNCETTETSVETMKPEVCDQGFQITPITVDSNTSPIPIPQRDQIIQVSIDELEPPSASPNRKSWHAGTSIFSKLFKSKGPSANNSEQDIPASVSREVQLQDASTETTSVILCDKETVTPRKTTSDNWTITPTPVMVNTGISPTRPATMDTGVETTKVTSMDQATYTETKQFRDSETETIVVVQDNETLTERIKMQDAQTSVQIPQETDETNTDPVLLKDAYMSTDDDWYEKLKPVSSSVWTETLPPDVMTSSTNTVTVKNSDISTNISSEELVPRMDNSTTTTPTNTQERGTMALSFGQTATPLIDVNTQTSEICFIDKSVSTSAELETIEKYDVECTDMATSTESLPYIGLMSEVEGDELFLIPESAFDIASSEPMEDDRDQIEMIDDCTTTDLVPLAETSSQTVISSAWQYEDPDEDQLLELLQKEKDGKVLCDIGINTIPKLTFEKQTSTMVRRSFSRGTMTLDLAKSDKSTSTFSHTRHIAETCFGQRPLGDVAHKVSSTCTTETVDMATNTDSSLMDERMAACISKLRNVSEKLQSPTGKVAPDYPWKRSDSTSSSERSLMTDSFIKDGDLSPRHTSSDDDRRKNILELVAQTESISRSKDAKHDSMPGRKAQPITTLKGKLAPPMDDPEQKSKSLPREYSDGSPKLSGRVSPSRLPLLRFHSAPGRIATVPNKSMAKISVPPGCKIPVCHQVGAEGDSINEAVMVKPKQPKSPLPAITESNTPPSDSGSGASFVSAASENSTEGNMDFASLRINVPPNRLSPCASFLAVPEQTPLDVVTEDIDITNPEDHDDKKPSGFMQKLFSKNSKKKKTPSDQRQPRQKIQQQQQQQPPPPPPRHSSGKKFVKPPAVEQPKPKSPKPRKKQAFVYVRQRMFSIQQDNVEDLKDSKKEPSVKTAQTSGEKKKSGTKSQPKQSKSDSDRPPSQYDNM